MITRRTALATLAATAATLHLPRAFAQSFPSKPITIVVPYPAGGPVDAVARLIADQAASELSQPITVDNRGGAAGTIGAIAVARAEPDGYTLILGTNQTHATNQSLLKSVQYDGVKDFAPVAGIADIPHVLVVRGNMQVGSVAELIDSAKKMPDSLNYGSTGVGSASHLAAELFKVKAGVDIRHIPFRGAAPMTQELVAGRLDLAFATLPSVIALIEDKQLKPLAVASAKRAQRLPDVPTLREAGVGGVEADAWFTLFAPAKTPPETIARLYAVVASVFAKDAAKQSLAKQGMTLSLKRPEQIAQELPGEVTKWAEVAKAANITVE